MSGDESGLLAHGFAGPADYIERITYAIWNEPGRDPSLVSRYYSPSTVIHLDGDELVGDQSVVANTVARLRTFPDFHGVIDDTIWTGSEREGYRTSMRWTWTGTDTGGSPYGPATGRPVTFIAIANCTVMGTTITEEWLGANRLSQVRQLGFSTEDAVRATTFPSASAVLPADPSAPTAAGSMVHRAIQAALTGDDLTAFSPDCTTVFAADQRGRGRDVVEDWGRRMSACLGDIVFHVDDQYEIDDQSGVTRVATQARLLATSPAGDIELSLISHHHIDDGRIVRQWLAYDELKLAHLGRTVEDPDGGLTPPTEMAG